MADIGNLSVRIDADTSGLERGAQRGRQELNELGSGMKRATGIAKKMTGALAAIGVGVGFGQAIREVANFQAAMNGLAAVSGATEQQMASLESQARTLGATSRFSAQQAAEGQRFLAQAGFSVNETLGATPGILQLATAAELDLGTAADIASNVLGGMRLEVEELNRVNDVLAATASRSNTSISQLGQALSFAAPFAAGAGISIEEAAAAIGNMSDAGIQASRAGTGLVGTIRQLSNVTDAGEDVLGRYGLSVADVNIEARGLQPVLETLRQANLSTADAIALFGSEAGAAAQVLVNDYNGAIEDATGEAERMANQLEQGLGPAFKSLQSAVSESVLQMGDSGLAGALEALIRTSTGVVSVFNGMGEEWAEANDASETLTVTVESLASAITVMSAVAGARAVQALGGMAAAKIAANSAGLTLVGTLRTLRTVMMTTLGPAGLAVGAVAILGELGKAFDDSEQEAKEFERAINDAADALQGFSEQSLITQIAAISTQLEMAKEAAQDLSQANTDLSRGNGILGGSISQVNDQVQGIADTSGNASEEVSKLEAQLQGLKRALDLVRDAGGSDGEEDIEDQLPRRDRDGEEDGEDADQQDPARFMGGIGIFGEDENQAFIERLKAQLEMRQEILREFDVLDAERQQEKFEADMERLREALELGAVTEEEFRRSREEAEHDHWSRIAGIRDNALSGLADLSRDFFGSEVALTVDSLGTILGALSDHSKKAFEIQKAAAIATALVNAYKGISLTLATYPYPINIGLAAAHAAVAFAQISKIKSQSFQGGGGGSASVGGGTGGGSSASSASGGASGGGTTQPDQNTVVTIQGLEGDTLLSSKQVRGLIEQINEATENGAKIRIAN